MLLELAFDKFGGVIDAKDGKFLLRECFSKRFKLNEVSGSFFTGFHEGNENVTRMATDKKDKVVEGPIARW